MRLYNVNSFEDMDEKSFEHIAGRLRDKAVMQARRFGLDIADAEDIAQDVMLRMWQMRDDLDRFRSPEALAMTIARRLVLNSLRRKHPESMDAVPANVASTASGPLEDIEDKDNEEWLAARMAQLPETWHAILYMRQVERCSSKEIAARLGIKETSVRTLLAKARKILLEKMKERR